MRSKMGAVSDSVKELMEVFGAIHRLRYFDGNSFGSGKAGEEVRQEAPKLHNGHSFALFLEESVSEFLGKTHLFFQGKPFRQAAIPYLRVNRGDEPGIA